MRKKNVAQLECHQTFVDVAIRIGKSYNSKETQKGGPG